MVKKVAIATSILVSGLVYTAPSPDFAKVEEQLVKNDNYSGHFIQSRKIQGLDKPILASGEFELPKKKGLEWNQEKPFKSSLKATKDTITIKTADSPKYVFGEEDSPMVFSFTKIFLSILEGDSKVIYDNFNTKFSGTTNNWTLVLTPKTELLSKALKEVTLKGGETITYVEVVDAQNNVMDIQFSDIEIDS
ncbi:LolA family protein [Francisella orientalis]|uniref:LolA family protein n=1 Tax=Francisella orientalis TaxID=299583 RepID=UPI00025D4F60|nr:outer membrane lipoprotein carrier protein LolA [Francisella orientalis]AFJ43471.1 hypothetical protein OOM_1012 [Francisella orientalis str. Toba 04]